MQIAILLMWMSLHAQATTHAEIKRGQVPPDRVPMIEITTYAEINGKLWACPVGSHMTSEVIGGEGENTRWSTYCKKDRKRGDGR